MNAVWMPVRQVAAVVYPWRRGTEETGAAQLTHQVAVVQYPSLTRSAVRHIELVPLTDQRLLLVLITDTGRVEQRAVVCPPGRRAFFRRRGIDHHLHGPHGVRDVGARREGSR